MDDFKDYQHRLNKYLKEKPDFAKSSFPKTVEENHPIIPKEIWVEINQTLDMSVTGTIMGFDPTPDIMSKLNAIEVHIKNLLSSKHAKGGQSTSRREIRPGTRTRLRELILYRQKVISDYGRPPKRNTACNIYHTDQTKTVKRWLPKLYENWDNPTYELTEEEKKVSELLEL